MERWYRKTAIVTGASSGIGEAIAEVLVKSGMQVVGFARRIDRVQANAAKLTKYTGKLHAVKCDIRSEEDICKAFEWTTKNVGIVHVLINNAGVLPPTNLISGNAQNWRDILETNVYGLCIAQREACKLMMANKIAGHIINLNSIAGQSHLYFPTFSIYGASKHAVTNICECLRQELNANKCNIKVTSISPGPVRNDMLAPQVFMDQFKGMPMLENKNVADAILYSLGTPPDVLISEIIVRAVGSDY
ncbi:farnesol dehydrogenase-like [Atheta coriaria]|uniref:farnesol dehydrogenase-like n=1 Tax=Dalotia coriaria TaxID=877792 RepID=UPI0031F3579B